MESLVLLCVHQLLGLLEVLHCLAFHGHQVDLAEKLHHLDAPEGLVDLVGLVNQDIPRIQEGP